LTRAKGIVQVKNLEERIKIDQLKEALGSVFSAFGNVVDIVAKKNLKAKGQAFIVYDDPKAAAQAVDEIQGFELFDKPMVVDFARTRSDVTVKRLGTAEELELHKRRRLAEKGMLPNSEKLSPNKIKERKQAQEAIETQKQLKRTAGNISSTDATTQRPTKVSRGTGLKSTNAGTGHAIPDEYLPPNKTLFVQNLPDEYDVDGLTTLFGRFEGFKEVRLVPGRKGIAFVEYETEAGAITGKENVGGMALGAEQKLVKVTYQRQ
jgi:RNA recognition motif-containing protein